MKSWMPFMLIGGGLFWSVLGLSTLFGVLFVGAGALVMVALVVSEV